MSSLTYQMSARLAPGHQTVSCAGPLSKVEDSWTAALTALRAVSPAQNAADIRDVLFSNVAANCAEGISAAAIRTLEDLIRGHPEGASLQSSDMGPFLDKLGNVLITKAEQASPGVRTVALQCLGALAHTALKAEQLAAMALAAQRRLTDVDARAADAAAEVLAVLGVPVALLVATGVNVGGMQDEPFWQTQVSLQSPPSGV